jgi:multimeric flavodoxin WrbA
MKAIAFNGSPRANGNTAQAIKIVFEELEKEGIETEMIHIGAKTLSGCMACNKCRENKDRRCVKDDGMNEYITKMIEADAIIIGSPVYYGNVSTPVKALIERCGTVTRNNGDLLAKKTGAAVVSVRRAGSNFTFAAINFFFTIMQMIIPGSSYWNMTLSRDPGDIQKDEEGINTFRNLGKNMAWLLKKTAK